ncbi:MAG: prolipoprotein diacylglyceryl transferase [Mycoplasmoidaceae bacterium]
MSVFLFINEIVTNSNPALPDHPIKSIPFLKWYGILAFLGFSLSILLIVIKLKIWYKIPVEPFYYFCFIAIPAGIFGAWTWSYIIGNSSVQKEYNLLLERSNFSLTQGISGLAIEGGVMAALITGLIYFPLILKFPKYQVKTLYKDKYEIKQISTFVYADAIVPTILIGQAIGRWGNMFNQELYGKIIYDPDKSFHWLKTIMPKVYEQMFIGDYFREPLFLYESFFNSIAFFIIWVGFDFFSKRKAGDLAGCYFIFYGIIRIVTESLRDKKYHFTTNTILTSLFLIFGFLFILYNHLYLSKNRDKKLAYFCYIYFIFFLKKIKYEFSKKYRIYIDKNDPNFVNYGNIKKIEFIRKKLLYYNGL